MARKKLRPKVMRMDPHTNNEVFSRECVNLGSLIARSKLENREWVYPVPSSELLNCGLSCIAKSTPVNKGTTQKKAQNKRNGLIKKRKEPELPHKCPALLFNIKIRGQNRSRLFAWRLIPESTLHCLTHSHNCILGS